MKKRDLWTGVVMIALGFASLAAALHWDSPVEALLYGFFGAFTAPGVQLIYKYCKWSSPKRAAEYREKLEQEQIELRDERKMMLRDKAGRYAYILGMLVALAAVLVVSVLEMTGVIGEDLGQVLGLSLAAYLVFQYLAGVVFYRVLARRY